MKIWENLLTKTIRFWALIALVCAAGAGLFLVQPLGSGAAVTKDPEPATAIIETGEIKISALGSGTLVSAQEVELGLEAGGFVEEVLVGVGDQVQAGDLLLRLDDADLIENLEKSEADLRELTSQAAVAMAALEVAEAQKSVLSAESELKFLISPYVFKAEIRLQQANQALEDAVDAAALNASDAADSKVAEAQQAVDRAALSLELNWESYYELYVPDFFNFPWRDRFGFWHDYFDPPTDIEVAVAWAELAAAQAWVEEAELYLAALEEGTIPEYAYGTKLHALENALEAVAGARESLESSRLYALTDGVIIALGAQAADQVGKETIITIARLDPLTIEAEFDEADWSRVRVGNRAEVVFDSLPEKTFSGRITFVNPVLVNSRNTSLVGALVELDAGATDWGGLPLGSSASIEVISGEAENAVLLPLGALQEDFGDRGLVLLQRGREFVQQEVNLGLRDLLYVEVTGGISAGDAVLIDNQNQQGW